MVEESNFTIETINLYAKIYPNTPIIVSSWEEDIKKLKKHISGTRNQKIHLISNKKPEYVGYKNINLQAISTKKCNKIC